MELAGVRERQQGAADGQHGVEGCGGGQHGVCGSAAGRQTRKGQGMMASLVGDATCWRCAFGTRAALVVSPWSALVYSTVDA